MIDESQLEAHSTAEFGEWLAENHATATGVWLIIPRSSTRLDYDGAVTEALRFGWIDSTMRKLDDERQMLRFSPRRAGSGWARSNKERIARLVAEGRLEPAGRALVETAHADGSWSLFDSVEALEVPDDLATAFDALAGARQQWDAFPPSAKKQFLAWIVQAKRPETRQKRVEATALSVSRGQRRPG